jgi:HK97 family phage portal protein
LSIATRLKSLLGLETKAGLASPEPWLFELFGATPSTSGISVSPHVALSCAPLHRAVRLIAETIASLPAEVYKRGPDGKRVRVPNHPIEVLLSTSVNDFSPASKFIEDVVQDAALYPIGGVAHVGRAGDGRVVELLRLDPEQTSLVVETVNHTPSYGLRPVAGSNGAVTTQRVNPRDLLVIPSPSLNGQGMVAQLKNVIGLALILEQQAAALFKNGARPGGIISAPQTTNGTTLANIKSAWNAAFGGQGSGGAAVMPNGTTYAPISFSSVDSQFAEMRQFSVAEISRAYGVPLHMLSDLSRATFRNSEQQASEFLSFCIVPWCNRLAGELSLKLFSDEERTEGFHICFDTDEVVKADFLQRLQGLSLAVQSRILNPNEARAQGLDLPPYDGGDEYINPHTTSALAPMPSNSADNQGAAE